MTEESINNIGFEIHKTNTALQEELRRAFLDCATIQDLNTAELPGKEVFSIDVANPEIWKSTAKEEQLLKLFGELCFVAFESRDNPRAYNLTDPEIQKSAIANLAEIKECQKIFVIAEKGKILGFAGSLIRQAGEIRMAIFSLMVVSPALRGGPYSKFLTKAFLSQENVNAYAGITHTPAAIKVVIEQSKSLGHVSYFGGQKEGEWGNQGSAEEQEKMRHLDAMVQGNYVDEYGDRSISGTLGYLGIKKLGIKGVIDPIPPVTEAELKFGKDDLLGRTFKEGLLKKNEENKPHTIYGIYVSFKQS